MNNTKLLDQIEHWAEFGEIGGKVYSRPELLGHIINSRGAIQRHDELKDGLAKERHSGVDVIPEMTDSRGEFWKQPNRSAVVIKNGKAAISSRDFQDFHHYNTSFPSGVYAGKMWTRNNGGQQYLCWYDAEGQVKYLELDVVDV